MIANKIFINGVIIVFTKEETPNNNSDALSCEETLVQKPIIIYEKFYLKIKGEILCFWVNSRARNILVILVSKFHQFYTRISLFS